VFVGYFQKYDDILEGVIISDKLTNRFRQGRRHARNQVRTSLDFSHHSSSQCHYQINNNITSLPTGKTKSTAQISIITTQLIQNSSKNSNTTSIFFWVRWKLQVDLIWWTIFWVWKTLKKQTEEWIILDLEVKIISRIVEVCRFWLILLILFSLDLQEGKRKRTVFVFDWWIEKEEFCYMLLRIREIDWVGWWWKRWIGLLLLLMIMMMKNGFWWNGLRRKVWRLWGWTYFCRNSLWDPKAPQIKAAPTSLYGHSTNSSHQWLTYHPQTVNASTEPQHWNQYSIH